MLLDFLAALVFGAVCEMKETAWSRIAWVR